MHPIVQGYKIKRIRNTYCNVKPKQGARCGAGCYGSRLARVARGARYGRYLCYENYSRARAHLDRITTVIVLWLSLWFVIVHQWCVCCSVDAMQFEGKSIFQNDIRMLFGNWLSLRSRGFEGRVRFWRIFLGKWTLCYL